MERRFSVRYEELMAEAEVKPEALAGVRRRLKEFVQPFAAALVHPSQREHAEEYVGGLVSNVSRWHAGHRSVGSHQARQTVGGRGARTVRTCGQSR